MTKRKQGAPAAAKGAAEVAAILAACDAAGGGADFSVALEKVRVTRPDVVDALLAGLASVVPHTALYCIDALARATVEHDRVVAALVDVLGAGKRGRLDLPEHAAQALGALGARAEAALPALIARLDRQPRIDHWKERASFGAIFAIDRRPEVVLPLLLRAVLDSATGDEQAYNRADFWGQASEYLIRHLDALRRAARPVLRFAIPVWHYLLQREEIDAVAPLVRALLALGEDPARVEAALPSVVRSLMEAGARDDLDVVAALLPAARVKRSVRLAGARAGWAQHDATLVERVRGVGPLPVPLAGQGDDYHGQYRASRNLAFCGDGRVAYAAHRVLEAAPHGEWSTDADEVGVGYFSWTDADPVPKVLLLPAALPPRPTGAADAKRELYLEASSEHEAVVKLVSPFADARGWGDENYLFAVDRREATWQLLAPGPAGLARAALPDGGFRENPAAVAVGANLIVWVEDEELHLHADPTPYFVEGAQTTPAVGAALAAREKYHGWRSYGVAGAEAREGGWSFPDRFDPIEVSEHALRAILADRATPPVTLDGMALEALVVMRTRDHHFLFVRAQPEDAPDRRQDFMVRLAVRS